MSFKRIRRAVDTIHDKLDEIINTDKHKEEDPKLVQDINRQHGDTIRSILEGIDLTKNRIENPDDPDFLEAMKIMRIKLMNKLGEENTLFDDLSVIDAKLAYIASAWASAVSEGYYNKAKWAMTALNKCVKEVRTNVPSDQAERVEAVLKERAEKVDVYINLIKSSAAIDKAEQDIHAAKVQIEGHKKKLEPIREEIVAARQDTEKLEMLSKIKGVQLGKLKIKDLNEKEIQLRAKLEEGVSLAKNIELLRSNIEKARVDLNTARNLFNTNRASLTVSDQPDLEELIASYRKILDDTVKATESALIYADKVRAEYLVFTKQMEHIWESVEGMNRLTDVSEFIDVNLVGGQKADVLDIAAGMLENIEEKEKRHQEAEERLKELLKETSTNSNTNVNFNT